MPSFFPFKEGHLDQAFEAFGFGDVFCLSSFLPTDTHASPRIMRATLY
jgi:hypothetical protein